MNEKATHQSKAINKHEYEDLRLLITKNKPEEALDFLRRIDCVYREEIILITARLDRLRREILRGKIYEEEATMKLNKIYSQILEIIELLEK